MKDSFSTLHLNDKYEKHISLLVEVVELVLDVVEVEDVELVELVDELVPELKC